jgi:hypothetical protein
VNEVFEVTDNKVEDTAEFIARHAASWSTADGIDEISWRSEQLDTVRRRTDGDPNVLAYVAGHASNLVGLLHYTKPDTPELWRMLRIWARAVAADGVRLLKGAGPVTVDLGWGPQEFPAISPDPADRDRLLSLPDIVDACHAAIATRDWAIKGMLAQIDLDRIVSPGITYSPHVKYHAQALQAFLRSDPSAESKLLDVMGRCLAKDIPEDFKPHTVLIESSSADVGVLAAVSDEMAAQKNIRTFGHALHRALTSHRTYWSEYEKPEEGRYDNPRGFFALGPLAWSAMRYDHGLPVNIGSDYLPRSIVEGRKLAGM